MTSIIYTCLMTLLWIVNLFNGTGLDAVYHVNEYAKYAIMLFTAITLLKKSKGRKHIMIDRSDIIIFGGMLISFTISSFIRGYGSSSVNYLWVFCLIYLIGQLKIDEKVFLWTGIIYGVAGAAVLSIYNFGTQLKGWNENSIAMIGMHSFLMFIIPFFNQSGKWSKIILMIATGLFSFLLTPTDSRSGILFMFVGAMFALKIIPRDIVLEGKTRIIILLIPLIIAIIVSIISQTNAIIGLNAWSYRQFHKPIFNGRDSIWRYGFNILYNYPLFGAGSMDIRAWHNSAVTCLSAYGVVGFILWISSFRKIIGRGLAWFDDYFIAGCVISFLVIYMQQSVELGLIASNPSIIAYIMLGMMLGRVRYLKANSLRAGESDNVQS